MARKQFIDEAGMHFRIEVGAAVLYHDKAVICVGSMEQRRKDDAAGCDPEQYERIDVIRSQDHVKIRTDESADPVLDDNDIVPFRSHCGMNRASSTLEHPPMSFRVLDCAEQGVARADLREVSTEANLDVD
jgi:hypothetical protein